MDSSQIIVQISSVFKKEPQTNDRLRLGPGLGPGLQVKATDRLPDRRSVTSCIKRLRNTRCSLVDRCSCLEQGTAKADRSSMCHLTKRAVNQQAVVRSGIRTHASRGDYDLNVAP